MRDDRGPRRRSLPSVLDWLVRRLPPDRAADVLGDLEESRLKLAQSRGGLRLRWWLWRQAASFAFWIFVEHMQTVRRRRTGGGLMSGLWKDLRFAVRVLGRAPAFTLITVMTLALGIGATTALFTVVNTVLWRPLGFPGSEHAVGVCQRRADSDLDFCGVSPPNMTDFRRLSTTLEDFGIARNRSLLHTGDDGTQIVNTAIATPGFLRTLGFRPALGRLFDEGDLPPNQHRVVVLTHQYWINQFGGDSSLVGRSVVYDDEPYEVIGVLAPDVDPPFLNWARIWRPLEFDPADETNREWSGFYSVARLAPNATLSEAQTEMTAIAGRLADAYPEANEGVTVQVIALRGFLVRTVRTQLLVFLSASALVLLIAAVNVANLILARAGDRQKEFAVRASLGAAKGRLVRQLLAESLVLCTAGGVAGFGLGYAAVRWFVALAPPGIPRLDEVTLSGGVATFTVLLLIGTVLAFGLAPAFRATSLDLAGAMKEGGRWTAAGGRLGVRGGLVVSEVALAVMLLASAGLLMRSFATHAQWRPGFDYENLGVIWMLASFTKYTESEQLPPLYDQVVAGISSIPGIESVGTTSAGTLFGGGERNQFTIEGRPDPGVDQRPQLRWFDVGPNYFPTLGLPIVRGRGLLASDTRASPPVAVINEAAARRYFPEEDPIGRRIVDREPWDGNEVAMDIVGVVQDVEPFDPYASAEPEIYWSNRQRTRWATYLVFRSGTAPEGFFDLVRRRLAEIDPTTSLGGGSTMEDAMGGRLVRPRFHMLLIGIFAFVAVTLASVGTYGVISYGVSGRTHEFGLRMSLGAATGDITAMVLRQGAVLGTAGVAIGLVAALALTRLMASMLLGVSARDPLTFAGVAVLLAAVVLVASYVPARRAGRVDPMEAMRIE